MVVFISPTSLAIRKDLKQMMQVIDSFVLFQDMWHVYEYILIQNLRLNNPPQSEYSNYSHMM